MKTPSPHLATILALALLAPAGCQPSGARRAATTETAAGQAPAMPAEPPVPPPRVRFEVASEGLPFDGIWKCRPAFRDVNGDGHLDLGGIVRHGNGPAVWLGDGGRKWTRACEGLPTKFSCGGGVDFGDINGDGKIDLAVAEHCHGAFLFLGDGTGRWTPAEPDQGNFIRPDMDKEQLGVPNVGFEDVALGEVNGDGKLDMVLIGSFEGGISVFHGDGTGRTWVNGGSTILPTTGWANEVLLVDMNADGHLDIVASYSEGPRVWAGDGRGNWTPFSDGLPSPTMHGLYMGIAAGDFNEDGRLDLAAANWFNDVEAYIQKEGGKWEQIPEIFAEMIGGANGVALADFDADGHLDLAVSGRKSQDLGTYYGVWVFVGDGKGGFTRQLNCNLPETGLQMTWNLATGDVDKDGVADFVLATGGADTSLQGGPTSGVRELLQVWLSRPQKAADVRQARVETAPAMGSPSR